MIEQLVPFGYTTYGDGSSLARDYLDKVRAYIDPANIRVVVDVTYEDTGMGDFRTTGGVKGRVDLIPEYEKPSLWQIASDPLQSKWQAP
jgi:hypothetical protein